MQKIKFMIGLFAFLVIGLFGVSPAMAANISITQLPGYISTNNFKLSYSCLGCSSVQFYVNKNGAGDVAFGPVMTDASGQVQVTSSEVSEQTSYKFTVTDGGVGSASTTTFYDFSGPSPVTGYYKERINDGENKIHWKNPGDSDFDKVVIYRGDVLGYSADSSHEIARVSGGPNSDMTYDDHFTPDASKTYYYLIRALDHAGNSSSLVGEGGETVINSPTTQPVNGKVTVLPKESGSVLGTEESTSSTPEATVKPSVVEQINQFAAKTPQPFKWILTHKKISIGLGIILILVAYRLYKFSNRNHKTGQN